MNIYIIIFLIAVVVIGALITLWICKDEEKQRIKDYEMAEKILDFCKKAHKFSDLKNPLAEITSLPYCLLFHIDISESFNDDTEISIVLYYDDKTVKNKIVQFANRKLYTNKIGKIEFM